MGRTSRRKRSTPANRAIVASVALILGGGGLVAVNFYASAGEGASGAPPGRFQDAARQMSTIDCPDAGISLPDVPDQARPEVDRELAAMDTQITDAYRQFADRREQISRDPDLAGNAVLGPLSSKRAASLDRIGTAVERASGDRPQGLDGLAGCSLRADDEDGAVGGNGGQGDSGQEGNGGQGDGQGDGGQDDGADGGQEGDGGQGQQGNGPEAGDFVDIKSVQPNVDRPRNRRGASRGTFTTELRTQRERQVQPGQRHRRARCEQRRPPHARLRRQPGDRRLLRRRRPRERRDHLPQPGRQVHLLLARPAAAERQDENDADADGGGKDQNVGEIQTPSSVTLKFAANPPGKVTAMPRFLRIITGDAKAFTNGDANANASWSCTGFEDRQLKDKYPICPEGSQVVRTFAFQSCWDGRNTDSANHRTHVAFADPGDGACPSGFKAMPQLVQRIVYDVPPGPGFAVDSFPEQLHKPVTDHGDFINVFDDKLMKKVVSCINGGRRCR